MFRNRSTQQVWLAAACALGVAGFLSYPFSPLAFAASQNAALRIVVLEGEDGVNIIQQKTAVKPTVEVRDRNDIPASGALVTFLLRGRAATFARGVRQVNVVADSAGRATVTELTPVSKGSFEIQVRASYQGQTATSTIHQTNYTTAADAANARSQNGTNAQSVAGQAGSGTGGGLSNGALVGIAGGMAAGAAATASAISSGSASNTSSSTPAAAGSATLTVTAAPTAAATTVLDPVRCGPGSRFFYTWPVTFTETAGVAVTLTTGFFYINGQQADSQDLGAFSIPARGSMTRMPSLCPSTAPGATVVITYAGTDANGHPISVTTPPTTLFPG